jgi:dTDP-4-dehydrorhamnose 3,5-epimerase-like enzyme
MAKLIQFPTFTDARGSLTVMQKELPFVPKRCFTVYDMKAERGGHGHMISHTVLFSLVGKIKVEVRTKGTQKKESDFYILENPATGLYLDPEDWHSFVGLTPDAFLLCIASHEYSNTDYFYERP